MGILGRIYALCLSVFYMLNPFVGPSTETPITGTTTRECNVRFIAWADSQVSNYVLKRDAYFKAACMDVENAKTSFDALLIAGDIAENGLACEYAHISETLPTKNVQNYLMAVGNHDVRLRNYKQTVKHFTAFANNMNKKVDSSLSMDALHYKYDINGYTFIILGTDRTEFEESYFSPEQLAWLDASVAEATKDGKPVFVVCHQTFKLSHGLPDTWNSPVASAGSVGPQSDELKGILKKYENVILISGHLHTGFGKYTYENIEGIHSVNLPSLTIDNKDGNVNDNGLGCYVEVFDNQVIFHARNFATGTDIPSENVIIDIV